jgi:hypothetical protein
MKNFYHLELDSFINRTLETADQRPLQETKEMLELVLVYLERKYAFYLQEDNDTRSGEETYGYESDEEIIERMIYISYLWQTSFRLRWLIDFIKLKQVSNQTYYAVNGLDIIKRTYPVIAESTDYILYKHSGGSSISLPKSRLYKTFEEARSKLIARLVDSRDEELKLLIATKEEVIELERTISKVTEMTEADVIVDS